MMALPHIHVVTDDRILSDNEFITISRSLMECPIALHLRGSIPGRTLYEYATTLHSDRSPGTVFINDRVDVAVAAGIQTIHLPELSIRPNRVREIFGADLVLGVSTHDKSGGDTAFQSGADYVFFGPAWETKSHPDRPGLGLEVLGQHAGKRVLAIGGVTENRVRPCIQAGAYGVAVISAVWDSPDPVSAAQALCDIFEG